MDLNEAQTPAALINPQLAKADWKLSDRTRVRFEVPVQGYDPTPWNGYTDYGLYEGAGTVLAVVEAKRTSVFRASRKIWRNRGVSYGISLPVSGQRARI